MVAPEKPGDDEPGDDELPGYSFDVADSLIKQQRDGWWKLQDSNQQMAWIAMCSAAAIAVLGVPIISLLVEGGATPSSKNIAASLWLLAVTLPVAGTLGVLVYLTTSPPMVSSGPGLLIICAGVAAVGVGVMNGLIDAAGGSLADFYCYNNGTIHETACRAFNEQGLASTPLGSPSQNAAFLTNVTVLLVDARGWVMVACGAVAGVSAGYLIRRAADPTTN